MKPPVIAIGVWLEDDHALDVQGLALACGVDAGFVHRLVDEGLLQPSVERPVWRFGGAALARTRRICRLQRDFDASLQSVAVMLDLIDEVEHLRARIRRAG